MVVIAVCLSTAVTASRTSTGECLRLLLSKYPTVADVVQVSATRESISIETHVSMFPLYTARIPTYLLPKSENNAAQLAEVDNGVFMDLSLIFF